ncbi:major histocompatibility complex class I-related gene protein-like isoform X2 [Carassius carassius]|uniref:major histocompatibility complex class I-related gene protein-like isoform X2 n=1 Tax=Carassius carassius TaxID=217509 RepID=UPI0028693D50|nr:major histocompatibility complex class I-related gene protein-like isoform X2 [Carassius carassius]
MKFIIFFIYIPLVRSELHTLNTTYTGVNGQRFAGTPEFSSVTTLDSQQIDDYDTVTKKLIPKQDWMKEFASTETWKEYTEIRERVQQINKLNIPDLMQRFSPPRDHTYQRVYGCVWDDETGHIYGFDEYSYDGQDFITLDLKENRYTASVPQAEATVMKWNEDRKQLDFLKQYYRYECVDWLEELVHFSKASLKKTGTVPESTEQSLTEPAVIDTKRDGKLRTGSFFSLYI